MIRSIRSSSASSTGRRSRLVSMVGSVGVGGGGGGGGGGATRRSEKSQVGTTMRELTGQRVAVGILLAIVVAILFTYFEHDGSQEYTMVMLHHQTTRTTTTTTTTSTTDTSTGNNGTNINSKVVVVVSPFADMAVEAARLSSIPNLFQYQFSNGSTQYYTLDNGIDTNNLRETEQVNVTIVSHDSQAVTSGLFSTKSYSMGNALTQLVVDVFILIMWFIGVTSFAGPVMSLVVLPIERMIRLLSMLTKDPLGYQNTPRFKQFMDQEFDIVKKTHWEEDVLRGMETSFLMSTILRIGRLMRVGFGSAGVEIIRDSLQRNSSSRSSGLVLNNSRGLSVSCIFLFCDIRQFTDATEALQEEVFVFTNKIAAVVHSICASYGGSANKNVGDAFLLSWRLDDNNNNNNNVMQSVSGAAAGGGGFGGFGKGTPPTSFLGAARRLASRSDQADRALYSVVKICIALHNDYYFLESMSELARDKLMEKIAGRKGPAVQLGFGLHAGRAVQGAIGSQRKIDPTYVAESVERSEMLEGLTKRYGLKVLMSNDFHDLLSPTTRQRCRKIDQVALDSDDAFTSLDDVGDTVAYLEDDENFHHMSLFTFDMDIDALFTSSSSQQHQMDNASSAIFTSQREGGGGGGMSDGGGDNLEGVDSRRASKGRRRSILGSVLTTSHSVPSTSTHQRRTSKRLSFISSGGGGLGGGIGGDGSMHGGSVSGGGGGGGSGGGIQEQALIHAAATAAGGAAAAVTSASVTGAGTGTGTSASLEAAAAAAAVAASVGRSTSAPGGLDTSQRRHNNNNNSRHHHPHPHPQPQQQTITTAPHLMKEYANPVAPRGLAFYEPSLWMNTNKEMATIRKRYTDGLFFQTFSSGLQSYISRDWDHAKQCFNSILERFEDGPSRYFLGIIEENNGVPPPGFNGYGTV